MATETGPQWWLPNSANLLKVIELCSDINEFLSMYIIAQKNFSFKGVMQRILLNNIKVTTLNQRK